MHAPIAFVAALFQLGMLGEHADCRPFVRSVTSAAATEFKYPTDETRSQTTADLVSRALPKDTPALWQPGACAEILFLPSTPDALSFLDGSRLPVLKRWAVGADPRVQTDAYAKQLLRDAHSHCLLRGWTDPNCSLSDIEALVLGAPSWPPGGMPGGRSALERVIRDKVESLPPGALAPFAISTAGTPVHGGPYLANHVRQGFPDAVRSDYSTERVKRMTIDALIGWARLRQRKTDEGLTDQRFLELALGSPVTRSLAYVEATADADPRKWRPWAVAMAIETFRKTDPPPDGWPEQGAGQHAPLFVRRLGRMGYRRAIFLLNLRWYPPPGIWVPQSIALDPLEPEFRGYDRNFEFTMYPHFIGEGVECTEHFRDWTGKPLPEVNSLEWEHVERFCHDRWLENDSGAPHPDVQAVLKEVERLEGNGASP